MDRAVILGAGTYGQVYSEYINEQGNYKIVGFLDDDERKIGKDCNGLKIIGEIADFEVVEKLGINTVFAPIGNNTVRVNLLKKAQSLGYETPGFIHESAIVHSSVKIGSAVYILPNSNIMPLTNLGDFVMVSIGVNIAHHVEIKKGCFFSQGSNVGASLEIGENTFVGSSSIIMTGIKSVGSNATIGAGAVVIRDVEDNSVMVGNPAKILKYNM